MAIQGDACRGPYQRLHCSDDDGGTGEGEAMNRSAHPLYGTWNAMKYRCQSKRSSGYLHYGGRGITVCERWINSFDLFCADMGERPSDRHQLDRIDNDGNYEPGNCRWATLSDNAKNKKPKDHPRKATGDKVMIALDRRLHAQLRSYANGSGVFISRALDAAVKLYLSPQPRTAEVPK